MRQSTEEYLILEGDRKLAHSSITETQVDQTEIEAEKWTEPSKDPSISHSDALSDFKTGPSSSDTSSKSSDDDKTVRLVKFVRSRIADRIMSTTGTVKEGMIEVDQAQLFMWRKLLNQSLDGIDMDQATASRQD